MLGKDNDQGDTLGHRLRSARQHRGWGIRELARQSGLDPSSISEIERGIIVSPRTVTVEKLATALGINPREIWGNEFRPPRARIQMGVAYVPIVERAIYAGDGDSWRDTGETVPVGGNFASPNHNLLAGRVTGSCMAPHVEPGDIVIWDQGSSHWVDGDMVAVTMESELLVKWAYRLADGRVLLAAPDGTEIIANGAILEGPIVNRQSKPMRGPRRG